MSEAKETKTEIPYTKVQTQTTSDLSSFSTFLVLKLPKGNTVSTQLIFRHGIPEDKFFEDFQAWYRILSKIEADGGDEPYVEFWNGAKSQPSNPAAPSNPASPSSDVNGKKSRKWDEPIPQAELPAELAEVTVDVFTQEFDVIKILPQPDEKATVEFWKDGFKFPAGAKINKAKYDTIKNYLSGLTDGDPIDPSKAGEYRIAGIQYWTQGNEYEYQGQKRHYKNIVLLKPAF